MQIQGRPLSQTREGPSAVNKSIQIAKELLTAVGGKGNVTASDLCMTRLRILTDNPSLVDPEQLSATSGVLGIVKRGKNGFEVVFGPGRAESVHDALVRLTGIDSSMDPVSSAEREVDPSISVRISKNPLRAATKRQNEEMAAALADDADPDDFESVKSLVGLLEMNEAEEDEEAEAEEAETADATKHGEGASASLLVINGPNINMLGIREPAIYGAENFQALLQLCQDSAAEAGFTKCDCVQSNHEGDLVDAIQSALGTYDGIVINPGAYTHTSIAILDAAKAVQLPIVEVHISKVEEREDFRQVSYIRAACFETVTGMGIQGYRKAIFDLAEKLDL